MSISDEAFTYLCNKQARSYASWRENPTPATERAMREAVAAVRNALRPETADV